MRSRFRLLALSTAVGLVTLGLSGGAIAAAQSSTKAVKTDQSTLTAAQVHLLAAHATDRSIIVFKNQFASLPATGSTEQARIKAVNAAQAPVLAELAKLHATNVQGYQIINAISATISPAEVKRLQANPAVADVVPDTLTHLTSPTSEAASTDAAVTSNDAVTAANSSPEGNSTKQVCPSNPAKPLIEPESLAQMNVGAAQQVVNGAGVNVGLIYDGIDVNDPDLIRPDGQHVVSDYQDFSGQGPNSATTGIANYMAGVIASQGNVTYDLSKFVNKAHPLPAGCNIKIVGVSPGANLSEVNWGGDDANEIYNSNIIQAIQYEVMVDHVNVLDEPFGGTAVPNFEDDPPALANQVVVAAGVVVVANTGDNGITADGDFDSPGGVPGVIGVGASTSLQYYRQTDGNGPNAGSGTGWVNNNISQLSTSGVEEFDPRTLDLVAPGDAEWGLCDTNTTKYFACTDPDNGSSPGITVLQSTSVSASEVAGVAALVIEAYSNTHHGTKPSPALVQQIIDSTATDLGAPGDHQGAGLVNADKAVQLAESINSSHPQGSTLLVNQTGLNATVNQGQSHTFSIGVTNEGRSSQTVTPTVSGNPTTVSTDTGSVTLSSASPTSVDGAGNTDSYQVHKFTVPSGTDYLNGDITWNAVAGGAAYEELFDPHGNLVTITDADNLQSGYGHLEVAHPPAGTWTTVIYTTSAAKYFGTVQYSYTSQDFHTAGSVSPASERLAPGQSGTFHVTVTAGQAGDESFSLHVGTGSSTDGAVPIVLRALVPISSSGGSFAGTLTGDDTASLVGGGGPGSGTAGGGQEFTYQFNVPSGAPELNIGIKMRDSDYAFEGAIVAPNSQQGLDLQSSSNNSDDPGQTMQFFQRTPQPGLWTVSIIAMGTPIDGAHLSEPFTGNISFTAPAVTTNGLPDSASTVLPAGQPVTATVNLTNTGDATKDFFADPRLDTEAPLTLLGNLTTGSLDFTTAQLTVPEPIPDADNPHYLVPTDTTKLVVTANSTLPITMDMNSDDNDPEELAVSSGDNALDTLSVPEASPGQEWIAPVPTGPFSAPVSGTTKLTAVATANAFDSAVTSSTGDAWQLAVNASAPYTPLTLTAGQSGTITLTITPDATKGTVVSGFIAIDTFNKATDSGDEIINIPYSYKVG